MNNIHSAASAFAGRIATTREHHMPKHRLKLVFTAACLGIGWGPSALQAWPSQKEDKSVPGLQVVRTWGELLDQPVISLADGSKVLCRRATAGVIMDADGPENHCIAAGGDS